MHFLVHFYTFPVEGRGEGLNVCEAMEKCQELDAALENSEPFGLSRHYSVFG